jgi:hypothetical protein
MAEDKPSASLSSIDIVQGHNVLEQLDEESFAPWESEKMENGDMEFQLCDGVHSIAKYTVSVNSALEFTVMVFHWPLPEGHTIYTERKRSIRGEGVKELLSLVENSSLCDELPEDHLTKSVALDPTPDITQPRTSPINFQGQLSDIQSPNVYPQPILRCLLTIVLLIAE